MVNWGFFVRLFLVWCTVREVCCRKAIQYINWCRYGFRLYRFWEVSSVKKCFGSLLYCAVFTFCDRVLFMRVWNCQLASNFFSWIKFSEGKICEFIVIVVSNITKFTVGLTFSKMEIVYEVFKGIRFVFQVICSGMSILIIDKG